MPFAVTHVLASIILVDLYRDYFTKHKKYFTIHTLFIAGLGGLLPDIDIPLNIVTTKIGLEVAHRGITHTPLFALLILIPGLVLWKFRHHKKAVYFFVISFGIFTHMFLDAFFIFNVQTDGIMVLYPLSDMRFGLKTLWTQSRIEGGVALDAIILLLWLWWEERRHKIKDFI